MRRLTIEEAEEEFVRLYIEANKRRIRAMACAMEPHNLIAELNSLHLKLNAKADPNLKFYYLRDYL